MSTSSTTATPTTSTSLYYDEAFPSTLNFKSLSTWLRVLMLPLGYLAVQKYTSGTEELLSLRTAGIFSFLVIFGAFRAYVENNQQTSIVRRPGSLDNLIFFSDWKKKKTNRKQSKGQKATENQGKAKDTQNGTVEETGKKDGVGAPDAFADYVREAADQKWDIKEREVVTVIDFWAPWAKSCLPAMKHLNDLAEKYARGGAGAAQGDSKSSGKKGGKNKGKEEEGGQENKASRPLPVRFVSVTGESPAEVEAFMEQHAPQIRYPVALDPQRKVTMHYRVTEVPHCFIVGPKRMLYWTGHTLDVEAPLRKLLGLDQGDGGQCQEVEGKKQK